MLILAADFLAQFRVPEEIGTTSQSLLLLLPLLAGIAVVYKATKMPKISFVSFIKESVVLFGSILVFMAITALVLAAIAWLVIE
jgi:hypothetical protein